MTGYQIGHGLALAQQVRDLNPKIPIVWGGVHPTIHPESTILHSLVDMVVVGDGEEAAVELARTLESGGDLSSIGGLVFKVAGQPVHSPGRPKPDLDAIPSPDYSLLDLNNYFTIGHISRSKQLQLVTSRGCPFHCGYCYLQRPELRGGGRHDGTR